MGVRTKVEEARADLVPPSKSHMTFFFLPTQHWVPHCYRVLHPRVPLCTCCLLIPNIKHHSTCQKHGRKHWLSSGQVWLLVSSRPLMSLSHTHKWKARVPGFAVLGRWSGFLIDFLSWWLFACFRNTFFQRKRCLCTNLHSWLYLWVAGLQGTQAEPFKAGHDFAVGNVS